MGLPSRKIEIINEDKTRTARYYKINAHRFLSEYETSLYVDGNISIVGDVTELIKQHKESKKEVTLLKHRFNRISLDDERRNCVTEKKDDPETMQSQTDGYEKEGFNGKSSMYETGIMIRNHNDPKVMELMSAWSHEVMTKSKRDQLSLGYACWKTGTYYNQIPSLNDVETKKYFKFNKSHRKK